MCVFIFIPANLDTGFGITSDDEALVQQQSQLLQLATTIGQQQQQLHQSMAGDIPSAAHAFSNRSPIQSLRQTSGFGIDSSHGGGTSSRRNKHNFYAGQTQERSRSNMGGK